MTSKSDISGEADAARQAARGGIQALDAESAELFDLNAVSIRGCLFAARENPRIEVRSDDHVTAEKRGRAVRVARQCGICNIRMLIDEQLARQIVSHEYAAVAVVMFGKPVLRLEDARRTTRRNQRLVEAIVRVVPGIQARPIGRRVARQSDEPMQGTDDSSLPFHTTALDGRADCKSLYGGAHIGDVSQILA